MVAVGPLVLGGEIPEGGRGGVVSSDDKRDQLDVYIPPGGIRYVPNNLDLTFRNDLISYLSNHYLI